MALAPPIKHARLVLLLKGRWVPLSTQVYAIHVSLTQRLTSRPRVRPVVQFFASSFEMMTMYHFMFESAVRVGSERANLPKRDNHLVELVLGMIIAVKFPAVVAEHSQL